ncbi:MAG TPA: calcium/proton exchanger [Terriglobales bacterium]|nr:calcium/proton exchanger [Terriglobales bacterium]
MTKDNALTTLWQNFPLKTGHTIVNVLMLALPAALVAHWFIHPGAIIEFCLAALAIIPLAGAMGEATEDLASHLGDRAGGLLNATMGNAAELIIGFFALRAGHVEIVKASISGSIIGNILLVFGISIIAGGLKRPKQTFSRQDAAVNSTMLFIGAVALIMPAVFDLSVFGSLREGVVVERLSLWTSGILIAVYASSMIFTFRGGPAAPHREPGAHVRSAKAATVALVASTVAVAYMSELLVGEIEAFKQGLGLSDLFIGVVVIAVIGNAAEHSSAILMAMKDKMNVAVNIAAGASSQIALLVAPLLVFISLFTQKRMSLVFTGMEIAGIALAVIVLEMIAYDGETNWFEGVELVAVYLILAIAFFFVPAGFGGH